MFNAAGISGKTALACAHCWFLVSSGLTSAVDKWTENYKHGSGKQCWIWSTSVNMPLGQSILRLELLDVQCRGNLWQDLPCLCPLLISGVKRPNQRSWQVDRELQERLWKAVLNVKHFGEYALGPEHSASWASRCSMPRESLARPPLLVPIADLWCQAA